MPVIKAISALEILDSRGRPTIKAYCQFKNGVTASASVPSGASTGKAEARELRDREEPFNGLGCRKAVELIEGEINDSLKGKEVASQEHLDDHLIQLDGTGNKVRLGANAILAVSLAYARATAKTKGQPLYQYFSSWTSQTLKQLPRPTINLFSGGQHAGGQIPVQDLLIVPTQDTMMAVLDCAYRVYQSAAKLCLKKYNMRALTADEGGLAPPFPSIDDLFRDALEAINMAGYKAGKEVMLAMDVAASNFYREGAYHFGDRSVNSQEMTDILSGWVAKYPIVSLEDGLAEDDWDHWPLLKQKISNQSLVVGDDLLCTNPVRIEKAIKKDAADTLLLKVNQIGTLTEALKAYRLARKYGWQVTISARSGETEDNWLADLAVGWQGDQIKIGSITQSERLSKYNRLLEIEKETRLQIISWPK